MYKIAGELSPVVFHIAARSLAAQGLSIFGDHSDVMAARGTGWALLSSASVQEAHDFALISQAATLESRVPVLHFFDGFRTSHEVAKIEFLEDDDLRALINPDRIADVRTRALSPDHPSIRGTAQNPDTYFQSRETVNPYYAAAPDIIQQKMDELAARTGRAYQLYEYYGAPDAERVIVIMGSGIETVQETIDHLNARGEKLGMVKVRMYRPFDMRRFIDAFPATVRQIAVLDRCKEPGSAGEPMYADTISAFYEEWQGERMPKIIGGRYGLSSKEFTPAMAKAVYDNLAAERPKNHFTVGILDDVTHTSLAVDPNFSTEPADVVRAVFWGLGADGTVGANKNSIKIIGEETNNYAQGYFVYDSKKSGSITISHLRFGPRPIQSPYLINQANFVACHQEVFLDRYDMLSEIVDGGVFLLNAHWSKDEVWEHLPRMVQEQIVHKRLKFYVIDANSVALAAGMGGRINTVMQVAFFAISGVLPREDAIAAIKYSIEKTYGKKGVEVVQKNLEAVDSTLDNLFEVQVPELVTSDRAMRPVILGDAPEFVEGVLGSMIARKGDLIPVSQLPVDGVYPSATTQYEKRDLADNIPLWDPDICIQCGKCAMVCPHAVIRIKVYDEAQLANAPGTFQSMAAKDTEYSGMKYTVQVSPLDCTGCGICVDICPAKSKSAASHKAINMTPAELIKLPEQINWDFFREIPELDRRNIKVGSIRQQQIQQPLFEFSGACAGCGETPYLKLISQLFGDRSVIANATGCSSIYGGNLPTTPWAKNDDGRGPAWANSLFEDNAEFGLGMRVALDKQMQEAFELLARQAADFPEVLVSGILNADQSDEAGIYEQRQRVAELKNRLAGMDTPEAKRLLTLADALVKKNVWIVGGDGWAYDIGFGGLDHVIATGRNVNILVLDTEVYSNTGGQMSKATPRGAVAKFAAGGKPARKKDLGLMAMTYGNVFVARVAMGARDEQTLRTFLEAEAYDGPSLIIAYSHCIAHGINMTTAMRNQKAAVDTGQWLLFRYNPDREVKGENPLVLDSKAPKLPVADYMRMENRFRMLEISNPEAARKFFAEAQMDVKERWEYYSYMASRPGADVGIGE
jgi:pyruvate-ferredoxin/flavodoxin oxidoreductase